ARAEGFWTEAARLRRRVLLLAIATFGGYGAILFGVGAPRPAALTTLAQVLRGAYLWFALLAIVGYGYAHLNRPFRWLPYANEAVYPWYILHQSLIVP